MIRRGLLIAVVESPASAAQIRAGAEAPSGAGDDHRANLVVAVDLVEGAEQVAEHLPGERIEALGTVQCEGQDSGIEVEEQGFVVHGRHGNESRERRNDSREGLRRRREASIMPARPPLPSFPQYPNGHPFLRASA